MSAAQKMPSHSQEAQRRHIGVGELRNVYNDIWLNTLAWVGRAEVGTEFALVNARFDALVDIHFRSRRWTLGGISIQRAAGGRGAEISIMSDNMHAKALPMPTTPRPRGVFGFKSICICYVDREVIAFLQGIRPLFNSDITLNLCIGPTEHRAWTIMAQEIWPLLAPGLTTLMDMKRIDFVLLRKHVSPTVLFDCVKLRKIYSHMFPRRPLVNDERHRFAVEEHLFNWLHTPRNNNDNNLPNLLRFSKWRRQYWQKLMADLKESFAVSSTAVNFIVSSYTSRVQLEPFDRQNDRTGECLSMVPARPARPNHPPVWFPDAVLLRCPEELDRMLTRRLWLRQTTEPPKSLVQIRIRDEDIGRSLRAETFNK